MGAGEEDVLIQDKAFFYIHEGTGEKSARPPSPPEDRMENEAPTSLFCDNLGE